jgi:hypothetical protein
LRLGGWDVTIDWPDSGAAFVARLEPGLSEAGSAFSGSPDIPGIPVVRTGSVTDRSTGKRVVDRSEFLSVLGIVRGETSHEAKEADML